MNEIVRKSTAFIYATVYGDDASGILADLTDANITCIFKDRYRLPDSDAIFTKTIGDGITILDAVNGKLQIQLLESDTDTAIRLLYFEIVVLTNIGLTLRSGIQSILINPNVKHQ